MKKDKFKTLIQIYLFLDMIYGLVSGVELLLLGSMIYSYRLFYIIVFPILLGLTFWIVGKRIKVDIAVGVVIQILIWIFILFQFSISGESELLGGVSTAIYMLTFRCLPIYVLLRTCNTYDDILEDTFLFIILSFVYVLVYFVGVRRGLYSSTDYMSFSYNLVYSCVISYLIGTVSRRKLFIIFSGIFLIFMTINGARGALLCAVIAIALIVLWKHKKISARNLFFWCCIIVAVLAVYIFRRDIVIGLAKAFPNSRTVYILQRDFIAGKIDSTGRDVVYEYCLDYIKHNVFGSGLLHDRYLIKTNVFSAKNAEWLGCYPHNLFLELLMQWGWIVGSVFIICIITLIGRTLSKLDRMGDGDIAFLIIIVSTTFIMLMISSSYLYSYKFYASLAILISLCFKTTNSKNGFGLDRSVNIFLKGK